MSNYLKTTATVLQQASLTKSAIVLLALLTVGCSNDAADRGEVTGTVTVDGVAPKTGTIAFTPTDGMAPTAGGKIADGTYSVKVPLGASKVAIRVPRLVGERKLYDTPGSPTQPINEESLPSKYNDETELTIEVTVGDNKKDFELSTK